MKAGSSCKRLGVGTRTRPLQVHTMRYVMPLLEGLKVTIRAHRSLGLSQMLARCKRMSSTMAWRP